MQQFSLGFVLTDYALIHLATSFTAASTMQIIAGPNAVNAHITGFPGAANGVMTDDVQNVSSVGGIYFLSPDGVLAPSSSGSPVWTTDASGQPDVTGLISAGSAYTEYAVQFTQAQADQINAWIAYDDIPDFKFISIEVASDSTCQTASVARLYHSALGRLPDLGGLNYWIKDLRQGIPLQAVAASFVGSPEFMARFGDSLTNAQYVSRIYEEALSNLLLEPAGHGRITFA